MRLIHGVEIYGDVVDDQTRCAHYNSPLDIIAIRFKCCGRWFPCRECHDRAEKHDALRWSREEFDSRAIVCGSCGQRLSVREYLTSGASCPACNAAFNPRCANHHHLYFEIDG